MHAHHARTPPSIARTTIASAPYRQLMRFATEFCLSLMPRPVLLVGTILNGFKIWEIVN